MSDYEQMTIPFESRPALGRLDFVVSNCNREAVELIDAYPNWDSVGVILVGDDNSGKTHLCHVWAERTNALWLTANDFDDTSGVPLWVGLLEKHTETLCVVIDDVQKVNQLMNKFSICIIVLLNWVVNCY